MNMHIANFRRLSLSALSLSLLMAAGSAAAFPGAVIIVGGTGGGSSGITLDDDGIIVTDQLASLEMEGVSSVKLTMTVTSSSGRIYEAQIVDSSSCVPTYDSERRVESIECDLAD